MLTDGIRIKINAWYVADKETRCTQSELMRGLKVNIRDFNAAIRMIDEHIENPSHDTIEFFRKHAQELDEAILKSAVENLCTGSQQLAKKITGELVEKTEHTEKVVISADDWCRAEQAARKLNRTEGYSFREN